MNAKHIAAMIVLALASVASAQQDSEEWNQWRGPEQLGVTQHKNLPVSWDDGKNIAWKRQLPGPGASQPVLWGDRIYVTSFSGFAPGGMKHGQMRKADTLVYHVTCLDRDSGKEIWSVQRKPLNEINQKSRNIAYHGWSTPTPVVDGKRLYCSFGTGGIWCFDLDGNELWHTSVGKDMPDWGYAASVVGFEDTLIVNACVESGRLLALDKKTGKEVWATTEGLGQGMNQITRSTPLVFKNAQGQWRLALITAGHFVQVHDPATGKLLWKTGRWSGGYASNTPVVNEDGSVLFVLTGGSHGEVTAAAVRTGDNVGERIIWQHERRGTALVPPVLYKGRLYYAAYGGVRPKEAAGLGCLDPKTGDVIYHVSPEKISQDYVYAPALAGDGKLYYQAQLTGTWVVKASDEFELLSVNILDEDKVDVEMKMRSRHTGNESGNGFVAMPVPLADGKLLLRGYWGLYCVHAAN